MVSFCLTPDRSRFSGNSYTFGKPFLMMYSLTEELPTLHSLSIRLHNYDTIDS